MNIFRYTYTFKVWENPRKIMRKIVWQILQTGRLYDACFGELSRVGHRIFSQGGGRFFKVQKKSKKRTKKAENKNKNFLKKEKRDIFCTKFTPYLKFSGGGWGGGQRPAAPTLLSAPEFEWRWDKSDK